MENLNESTSESSIDRNDFFSFLQSKDAQDPGIKLPAEVDVIDLDSDEDEDQDEVSILLSESKETCEESYNTTEESCQDEVEDLVEIVLSSDTDDEGVYERNFEESLKTLVESKVSSTVKSLSDDLSKLDHGVDNIDQLLDETQTGLVKLRALLDNNNLSVDKVSKTQHEDSLNLSIDILDEDEFDVNNYENEEDAQNSVFVQCQVLFLIVLLPNFNFTILPGSILVSWKSCNQKG